MPANYEIAICKLKHYVVVQPSSSCKELIVTAKANNKYDMRFFCNRTDDLQAESGSGVAATSVVTAGLDGTPPLVYVTQWPFDIGQCPGYTPRNVETNDRFPLPTLPLLRLCTRPDGTPCGLPRRRRRLTRRRCRR